MRPLSTAANGRRPPSAYEGSQPGAEGPLLLPDPQLLLLIKAPILELKATKSWKHGDKFRPRQQSEVGEKYKIVPTKSMLHQGQILFRLFIIVAKQNYPGYIVPL